MKILVINTGSSSIKYQLFIMEGRHIAATGLLEKIGESESKLVHHRFPEDPKESKKTVIEKAIPDHREGLALIVQLLTDEKDGVIHNASEISAVGHRVVHGGETFHEPTLITPDVVAAIKANVPLAPLHNPANLIGIEVSLSFFASVPQVAIFDTAFHQSLPPHAFRYALPEEMYKNYRIRRYGFHGTSHLYVANRAAELLGKPLSSTNLITLHLGNGASMAAISNGKSVDTSMGMTPLEGLIMGTRSGDIDPAIPFYLGAEAKMTVQQIDSMLNKQSGLKGLCGRNDMREIQEAAEGGDQKAELALQMYCYRIRKYIGAYSAVLGRVDAIVYTAGIGQNSAEVRKRTSIGLENMGIVLDLDKNSKRDSSARVISTTNSAVKILVIPTNEELEIAEETMEVLNRK